MKTRTIFLLDRSGSMKSKFDDTVGGFNAYLEELQKDDNASDLTFTRVQFDSNGIDTEFSDLPVRQVPGLDKDNFKPDGMTPLLEAATKTIEAAAAKEWNGKTIIIIMTDGQENTSKAEYTNKRLADLIAKYKAEGWEFIFMGAGIDAYHQSSAVGISAQNTVSYNANDRAATMDSYECVAKNTRLYASGQASTMSFSNEQKQKAGDKFVKPGEDVQAPSTYPENKPQEEKTVDHLNVKL